MPGNPGGLWWLLGGRKPSKTETVDFNVQTQVTIPLLQAISIAVCSVLIFILWVVLWLSLPRGWASGTSWTIIGFVSMIVGFWVGKRRRKSKKWVLLFPAGAGIINYVAMSQSDLWWSQFWVYALGLAIGLGIVSGAVAPVYLFARETISRYEATEFEEYIGRWLEADPSRLERVMRYSEERPAPPQQTEETLSPMGKVLQWANQLHQESEV